MACGRKKKYQFKNKQEIPTTTSMNLIDVCSKFLLNALMHTTVNALRFFSAPLAVFLLGISAHAQLPFDHLSERVLREPNPFSFISFFTHEIDLAPEDFTLDGTSANWIPGSLQWARVGNGKDEAGILVPRARARVNGKETEVALTQTDNSQKIRFKQIGRAHV